MTMSAALRTSLSLGSCEAANAAAVATAARTRAATASGHRLAVRNGTFGTAILPSRPGRGGRAARHERRPYPVPDDAVNGTSGPVTRRSFTQYRRRHLLCGTLPNLSP